MNPISLLRTYLPVVLLAVATTLFGAPAARAALPVIYAFNQSGTGTINVGESVTLNWSVSNGAQVSISPDVGPITGTEVTVTPSATTTYTLTAKNSSGSVSKSKKITVIVPPTVNTLAATPSTVLPGAAVTLAWTGTGATYYTVTTDAGDNLGNVFGTSTKVYPQTSTTYTVTAVNTAGTGARSVPVVVVPPGPKPTISSFSAAPATIAAGQSTTLNWSVSNADSLSISPNIGSVTGTTTTVTPAATTTYTLTAKNLNGSVTKKTTVTVTVAPPTIDSFTATPPAIVAGQSSTLAWSVTGAASLSISPGIGAVTGSSIPVSPSDSTVYTLTATNAGGSVSQTVALAVSQPVPPPTINSFAAQPAVITEGQASTLVWSTDGASEISIAANVGASPGIVTGNSYPVSPAQSTTYTLTARNESGAVTRTASVTVNPPAPAITSFAAAPVTIFPGQSSQLSWSVNGNATLELSPDIGAVSGNARSVSPQATTTYTLTATNAGGSDSKSVTVNVSAPVIGSFTATPATIVTGDATTLAWIVDGASEVSIAANVGASPGVVTGNSHSVSPTQNTVYTLTATNAAGSVTQTVAVTVKPPAPTISAFTASPSTIDQGGTATLSWSAIGATTFSIATDVGNAPGVVTGNSFDVHPSATTNYILTAANETGSVTASVKVTVLDPAPVIRSFVSVPNTITVGETSTLSWDVSGAATLSVEADVGASPGVVTGPAGSYVVKPAATTNYTMTATSPGGVVSHSFTQIIVKAATPAPVINSFAANPASITRGSATTLSWDITGADSISVSPGIGAVTGTSVPASPAATTTYTVTATNVTGSVTRDVVVTVTEPAPVTVQITPSTAQLNTGAAQTFSATVANSTNQNVVWSVVETGGGSITSSGLYTAPAVAGTYHVKAVAAADANASAQATITVSAPAVPAPTIDSFTATPSTIQSGGSATLAWSVTGADTLTISPDIGAVTGNSRSVSPTATTTYTLTATNTTGSVTSTATVTVNASTGPSIDTFTASADSIEVGEAVTLTWTTTKMGSLWMSADAGGDPGSVAPNGSYVAHPQTTTRYTISGWNGDIGAVIYKSVTVRVGPPPTPTINSFAASPATIAIGSSTTLNWSVANADTVTIVADAGTSPGVVTGNSLPVSPTTTTTYTLTASLGSVSATASATVTVTGPTAPVIGAFYAQPAFIKDGESSTLRWTISGADHVSISPDIGEVTGDNYTVTPSATTTYTLSATNDIGTSTRTTVVTIYVPGTGSVTHPRIWVTPASLPALVARAQANDPAWIRLRNACDTYVTWRVAYPDEPNASNTICGGYNYYDYALPSYELSLGYMIAKTVDPTRAALYAAKEREVLLALSDPVHHGFTLKDDGYPIRTYVPALAIGYDWIFETLSDSDRAQIFTEINRWIADYEAGGFGRGYPQGNYFAGYYAAKAIGALATEGENPIGPEMWNDWLTKLHYGFVQPYHQQWMSNGSAPDGWGYGKLETLNMLRPLAAAFTAKGLDLIHDAAHPHDYPDGNVKWVAHFTWPDMKTVSDRGLLYDGDNFTATDADWATQYAGFLRLANANNAPMAQRYALDLRSLQGNNASEPWTDMLLFDASAPTANYRTDLSYHTTGTGEVAMRSSWNTDAVWASFQSGPYVGYPGSAEEQFDQGSLAIQRGGVQFLVNAWGATLRNTPGTDDGNIPANLPPDLTEKERQAHHGEVFNTIYNEVYSTSLDGIGSPRRVFNTYYAVRSAGYYGQGAFTPGTTATTLSRFEEGNDYVLARGANLEGMYYNDHPISLWDRTVVYLRPQLFVVHDRTGVDNPNADNWMAWHVAAAPVEQSAVAGTHRFDVVDTRPGFGGNLYRGRVTTVLPAGHVVKNVDVFDYHKVYRLEVRSGAPTTSNTWLTVFDAAASAAQAGEASPLTAASGALSTASAEGTLIHNSVGSYAVLFSKSATPIAGSFTLTIPTAATYVLVADLAPSTGYSVTATVANGSTTIAFAPGGSFTTTSQGTLKVNVSAAGIVTTP
ncbi:MAG: hypothetical protein KF715_14190 [Candidatus Didemnitutus sp.]|nr:hypothetical protein [Candidatus Didemnitutus sp.]